MTLHRTGKMLISSPKEPSSVKKEAQETLISQDALKEEMSLRIALHAETLRDTSTEATTEIAT